MTSKAKHDAIEIALDAALVACARKGLQLTNLRRQVLSLILEADGPLTAYQLLARLKESRATATPPTIYRVLDFLVEQELVHKVERLNAFIACTEADHHHNSPVQFLICRQCGSVAEIEDRAVSNALEQAAILKGFHPGRAVVELDGTCADCFQAA
jgi:Fur family zinc uptake transcriptional regulator